ncbi:MAG: hypothetical protein ACREJL_00970 [Candidatus Methylomirabilales bacterium]
MSESLVTVVVGGLVGVLATIITIFLTPRLQHYFWQRQRLAEVRFEVVDKLNWLMAEFISDYIAHERRSERYSPRPEFFKEFQVTTTFIKSLFSAKSWEAFKAMEVKISPWLGGAGPGAPAGTVEEFIQARDRAFRALYREIGLDLPEG